jgi:hypothetical protein
MHYYTTEILGEAKLYMEYSKNKDKKNIEVNDVRLAIEARSHGSFTRPLPITYMRQIA